MALALDPTHIAWCRSMFALIADDGVWGVPRSGLMFQKKGTALVLYAVMPWEPAMPISPDELYEQQRGDYEGIKEHFEAAGITVSKKDGLEL